MYLHVPTVSHLVRLKRLFVISLSSLQKDRIPRNEYVLQIHTCTNRGSLVWAERGGKPWELGTGN